MKVGTAVYLSEQSQFYGDHPEFNPKDTLGRIISTEGQGLPIEVEWDNKVINSYNYHDLVDFDLEAEKILLGEEDDITRV